MRFPKYCKPMHWSSHHLLCYGTSSSSCPDKTFGWHALRPNYQSEHPDYLDCIGIIASCMCPAIRICNIRQFFINQMILTKPVRNKNSLVVFVEFQRDMMITPFLVFVDHNRTFLIQLTGSVHPHVTLRVGMVAVFNDLSRRFV